ncbi:hypothetical protein EJB05_19057, partial [Eragrostis curvula]
MAEMLLPLPFYMKINEIGLDLHSPKKGYAKNWPGACPIAHENGLKRQFSRKLWVSAPLSLEKWLRWSPMVERLVPLPLCMKINEILMDLHCPKMASNMCTWPQNNLKEAAHAPKFMKTSSIVSYHKVMHIWAGVLKSGRVPKIDPERKRQLSRKPSVSAPLSKEKWPGRCPIADRLLPIPFYMKING